MTSTTRDEISLYIPSDFLPRHCARLRVCASSAGTLTYVVTLGPRFPFDLKLTVALCNFGVFFTPLMQTKPFMYMTPSEELSESCKNNL